MYCKAHPTGLLCSGRVWLPRQYKNNISCGQSKEKMDTFAGINRIANSFRLPNHHLGIPTHTSMGCARVMRGCSRYVCALVVSAVTDGAPRCFCTDRLSGATALETFPMFNTPKSNRSILSEVLIYMALVAYYLLIPLVATILSERMLHDAVFLGNEHTLKFVLLPLTVAAVPYWFTKWVHGWTGTDNIRMSKLVSYTSVILWILVAIGEVQGGRSLLTDRWLISVVVWASVLYFHYTVQKKG